MTHQLTISIRPELIYPCPLCGSLFSIKKHVKDHVYESHWEAYAGLKLKFKFLKPV